MSSKSSFVRFVTCRPVFVCHDGIDRHERGTRAEDLRARSGRGTLLTRRRVTTRSSCPGVGPVSNSPSNAAVASPFSKRHPAKEICILRGADVVARTCNRQPSIVNPSTRHAVSLLATTTPPSGSKATPTNPAPLRTSCGGAVDSNSTRYRPLAPDQRLDDVERVVGAKGQPLWPAEDRPGHSTFPSSDTGTRGRAR